MPTCPLRALQPNPSSVKMFKKIVYCFFRFLIAVAYWSYRIEGVNALFLIMPAKLIVPTLRRFGAVIGENALIHSPLVIHNAGENYGNLTLGNDCYLGRDILLDLKDKIHIGDRVTLSMRVTLITHTDVGESDAKKVITPSHAPLSIDVGAYLGANVTVLQGVRIGSGSVVGAGCVVLHDVPPRTIAAGNPAKEIKRIDE